MTSSTRMSTAIVSAAVAAVVGALTTFLLGNLGFIAEWVSEQLARDEAFVESVAFGYEALEAEVLAGRFEQARTDEQKKDVVDDLETHLRRSIDPDAPRRLAELKNARGTPELLDRGGRILEAHREALDRKRRP